MNFGLEGKNALITGGSHGIGLAIAKALLLEGCNIAIIARDPEKLKAAHDELYSLLSDPSIWFGSVDVLQPESIDRAMKTVTDNFSHIDILINNVGGGGRWGKSFEDTDDQVWIDVYNKNAMAAIRFTKLAVPFMRKQKWGRVVTIASIYGREAGGRAWFNMAKSAEISLMKTLSLYPDLVGDGITFNSVAPGFIKIEGNNNEFPSARVGTPEDIAAAVVFLCSKQAKFINGACLSIDGGESKSF